jgi:hypothetical protein
MNLPQLPTDKANHAIYGAVIFDTVYILSALMHLSALPIAAVTVVVFAFGKEAHDAWSNYKSTGDPHHGSHGVELNDALATISGGILAALPLLFR